MLSPDNFVWGHPDVATAWFTLFAALVPLLISVPTILLLVKYTRSSVDLRNEAVKQSEIQSETYEASVMPLLVVQLSRTKLSGNLQAYSVAVHNVGNGPALGVQVDPIQTPQGVVHFDYIPMIEPGKEAPLICVRNTPEPETRTMPEQIRDSSIHEARLYQYARHYVLANSDDLKITTHSLSNTVHEFFHKVEHRGSDTSPFLVYSGRKTRPGTPHGPRTIRAEGSVAGGSGVSVTPS